MPNQRLSKRKIKEVLRLKWANQLSHRKIAKSCNISRPVVASYIKRAEQAGLSWPLPDNVDDVALEKLLFPATVSSTQVDRGRPDWLWVHQELKKKKGIINYGLISKPLDTA